jgi:hypothetical protein
MCIPFQWLFSVSILIKLLPAAAGCAGQLVVACETPPNVTNYIQARGRARHRDSQFCWLLPRSLDERAKVEAARDALLQYAHMLDGRTSRSVSHSHTLCWRCTLKSHAGWCTCILSIVPRNCGHAYACECGDQQGLHPPCGCEYYGIAGMEDDISAGGFSSSADSRLPLDRRKFRCAAGNRLRHMGHVGLQRARKPNHETQSCDPAVARLMMS